MGGGARNNGENGGGMTVSIMADELLAVETAAERLASGISLALEEGIATTSPVDGGSKARLQSVLGLLKENRGKAAVYFTLNLEDVQGAPATVRVKAANSFCAKPTLALLHGLRQILPPGAVRVSGENTKPKAVALPAWKKA